MLRWALICNAQFATWQQHQWCYSRNIYEHFIKTLNHMCVNNVPPHFFFFCSMILELMFKMYISLVGLVVWSVPSLRAHSPRFINMWVFMSTESTNVAFIWHNLVHGMHCENISTGIQIIRYILAYSITNNLALCLPTKSTFVANMALAITVSSMTDSLMHPYRSVIMKENVGAMLPHIPQRWICL